MCAIQLQQILLKGTQLLSGLLNRSLCLILIKSHWQCTGQEEGHLCDLRVSDILQNHLRYLPLS